MEGMSRVSEKRVWGMKSWWEKPFLVGKTIPHGYIPKGIPASIVC